MTFAENNSFLFRILDVIIKFPCGSVTDEKCVDVDKEFLFAQTSVLLHL